MTIRAEPGAGASRPRSLALVVAPSAAVGATFHPAVAGWPLAAVTAVAAVVPVLLVTAVRAGPGRSWPVAVTMVGSGLVWSGLAGMMLFLPRGWFLSGWPELVPVDACRNPARALWVGTSTLLEYLPPAAPDPVLLVLPGTLVWLAAAVGAELVLVSTGAGRRAVPLLPAVPALTAWAAAVALAVPTDPWHLLTAGVQVVACVLLLPVRSGARWGDSAGTAAFGAAEPAATGGRHRLARPALPIACLAALVIAGLTDYRLFDRKAWEARDASSTGVAGIDVLQAYDTWRAAPGQLLFTARAAAPAPAPAPAPASESESESESDSDSDNLWWRLATLDDFGREVWTPAGGLRRVGLRVPGVPASPSGGRPTTPRVSAGPVVRQVVVEPGLAGPFRPAIDRVDQALGDDLWINADTGDLVGDASVYQIRSLPLVRTTDGPAVGGRLPAASGAVDRALHAQVPEGCVGAASRAVSAAESPSTRPALAGLLAYFGEFATVPPDGARPQAAASGGPGPGGSGSGGSPPGGHDCTALSRVLSQRQGSTSQLAAAFAVVARQAGLPARVAVGFGPGRASAEARTFRGEDARVWAEVVDTEHHADLGWMPVHPGSTDPRDLADNAAATGSRAGPGSPAGQEPGPGPGTGTGGDGDGGDGGSGDEDPGRPAGGGARAAGADAPGATADNAPGGRSAFVSLLRLLLIAVALLLGSLLIVLLGLAIAGLVDRLDRRRARHRGSPADRIVAAWRDAVRELGASGVAVPAHATASEIVMAAQVRMDPAVGAGLGVLAQAMAPLLYGPGRATGAAGEAGAAGAAGAVGPTRVADTDAISAWHCRDLVVRHLRRHRRALRRAGVRQQFFGRGIRNGRQ